jgi:hypothetical protein
MFCDDELWNRDKARFVPELGYTQPSPVILAIKEIILDGKYENKIKFCRYYTASRSDPVCAEYNIKWFPTAVIFRDGNVFWTAEGGGCFVEESRGKIEENLRKAVDEM